MDNKRQYRRYLKLIGSWSWLIVLGALLAGGANYALNSSVTPQYDATTTLMVGKFIQQSDPSEAQVGVIDRLAGYYLEIARRQPVLEGVKKELKLSMSNEELVNMLSLQLVPNTSFLEVKVTDKDPIRAVQIANSFATQIINQTPAAPENQKADTKAFVQQQLDDLQIKINKGRADLQELNQKLNTLTTSVEITEGRAKIRAAQEQIDTWQSLYLGLSRDLGANSPNSITVLEAATQAQKGKVSNPLIGTAIAAAIGALLAVAFAILMEYLDDRIKSADDVRSRLKLQVLGQLTRSRPKRKQVGGADPTALQLSAREAEAYEIICTSVLFSGVFDKQRKSLLVTAPGKIADQPQMSLNLAASMLSFEPSVLVIDANTHQAKLHDLLGVPNQPGFTEVFYGNGYLDLQSKIQETSVPNLYLMSAGEAATESQQIVSLRPGTQQIYSLPDHSQPCDFVIFNGESLLNDKTTRLLASRISGTVLLCELKGTRTQEMRAAIEVTERLRGNLLGVILVKRPSLFGKLLALVIKPKSELQTAKAEKPKGKGKIAPAIAEPSAPSTPALVEAAADSSIDAPELELETAATSQIETSEPLAQAETQAETQVAPVQLEEDAKPTEEADKPTATSGKRSRR